MSDARTSCQVKLKNSELLQKVDNKGRVIVHSIDYESQT
jgi:hypothetical protein